MTTFQKKHAKRIERARNMTIKDRIALHTKGQLAVEAAWFATYLEYAEKAGDDLTGRNAMISNRALATFHKSVAFHLDCDALALEYVGYPVTLDGSR